MAAENNLWQTLRPALKEAGFFVQRIENTTGAGVPDVWVANGARYAWLELKAQRAYPARATTPVFGRDGLRTEQENWLTAAHRAGVVAYVVAGVGVGALRTLYAVPATRALEFNRMDRTALAQYAVTVPQLLLRLA